MGLEDWTGSDWEREGKGLGFGVWGAPAPAQAPANGRRLLDRARYKLQVQTSSKYEVRGYGATIGLGKNGLWVQITEVTEVLEVRGGTYSRNGGAE